MVLLGSKHVDFLGSFASFDDVVPSQIVSDEYVNRARASHVSALKLGSFSGPEVGCSIWVRVPGGGGLQYFTDLLHAAARRPPCVF